MSSKIENWNYSAKSGSKYWVKWKRSQAFCQIDTSKLMIVYNISLCSCSSRGSCGTSWLFLTFNYRLVSQISTNLLLSNIITVLKVFHSFLKFCPLMGWEGRFLSFIKCILEQFQDYFLAIDFGLKCPFFIAFLSAVVVIV